ncbi:hypothetical protein [Clostridium frigidicarnis]|uniref:Uncharacterized protein n=1 Tax=Clostridium frigidicarnis TaxID=84698 RepID=A0A1I1AKF7_9CLOT|nr:hypothetical protein [Clostridium frigidicarnis]SFB38417.1 hypothetical protein SAMN04488528_10396 [Clostridium frigidicarnis]
MNRDEFNMLNVEQQVNYINSRLDEDLTLRDVIERELNLPRSTIRNRFTRNKYVFNKRANKYIKNSEVKDSKVKNNINMNLPKDESKKNISGSNMDIKQDKTQKTQCSNMNITKSNIVVGPLDCKDKNKSNLNEKDNKFKNIQEGNINITKSNIGVSLTENEEKNKSKNASNIDNNKIKNDKGSNIDMDQLKDESNIDAKLDKLRKKIKDNIDITKNKSDTIELDYKETTEILSKNNIDETLENKEGNIEVCSLKDSEIIGLRKLLKHKDDILSLLDNNHVNKAKDTNINVSQLNGELTIKTLKIYDSVLKEFNEFIKDHKEFKQQDIISLALKEFLERHR